MEKKKKIIIITSIISILILALVGFFIFMNMRTDAKKYNEALQTANKYYAQAEYEKAEDYYLQAINIDKKQVEPYIKIADTYIKLDKAENAKEKDQKLIKDKLKEIENILNTAVNNGKTVVRYKDKTYYWKYNQKSFEDGGVFANFPRRKDTPNSLVCLDNLNKETIIYTGKGGGNIWIINDKIYFNDEYDLSLYKMDLNGHDKQSVGKYYIKGVYQNNFIVTKQDNSHIYIYNTDGGQISEIISDEDVSKEIVALDDNVIYYTIFDYSQYRLTLKSVSLDSFETKAILTLTANDVFEGQINPTKYGIECVQIHDDTIYFSYGCYMGTAIEYSYGHIARISKDGSGFTVLQKDLGDGSVKNTFTVSRKNNQINIYNDGKILEPFTDNDFNVYVYDKNAQRIPLLINNKDYKVMTQFKYESGNFVQDIEYVNNYVYYKILDCTNDSSYDMGWRIGYRWNQITYYRKNLKTNNIEELYSIKK